MEIFLILCNLLGDIIRKIIYWPEIEKFFEWQYVDRGKVNMYIAIDGNKVYAMVGIDVDQLLQEEIHPRYCYGTEYSSRTIRFHKLLGHEIIRLRHFYRLSDLEDYKIAQISTKNIIPNCFDDLYVII